MGAATSQGFGQDELITSFGVRADPWPWHFPSGSIHNFVDDSTVGKEVCWCLLSTHGPWYWNRFACILYRFLKLWNTFLDGFGWHRHRYVLQHSFKGPVLGEVLVSQGHVYDILWFMKALSILHPGTGIYRRDLGILSFFGFKLLRIVEKRLINFFGSWISLSCKFLCQTEIFVSVPLHPLTVLVFYSFTTWRRHYMSKKYLKL